MSVYDPLSVAIVSEASQAVATNYHGILARVGLSVGTAPGEAIVYSGSSTDGAKLAHVNGLANNYSQAEIFVPFSGGIYVDVNGEIDAVNIWWR